jgi:hypothetical protein
MPSIFSSGVGVLAHLHTEMAVPAIIETDLPVLVDSAVLLTGIEHTKSSNTQIVPSLQNVIYSYTTGENIGYMVLSGIAFGGLCDSTHKVEEEDGSHTEVHAISAVYDLYDDYTPSKNSRLIIISIGSETIYGLLHELKVGNAKADQVSIGFTLSCYTIPDAIIPVVNMELPHYGGELAESDTEGGRTYDMKPSSATKSREEIKAEALARTEEAGGDGGEFIGETPVDDAGNPLTAPEAGDKTKPFIWW